MHLEPKLTLIASSIRGVAALFALYLGPSRRWLFRTIVKDDIKLSGQTPLVSTLRSKGLIETTGLIAVSGGDRCPCARTQLLSEYMKDARTPISNCIPPILPEKEDFGCLIACLCSTQTHHHGTIYSLSNCSPFHFCGHWAEWLVIDVADHLSHQARDKLCSTNPNDHQYEVFNNQYYSKEHLHSNGHVYASGYDNDY